MVRGAEGSPEWGNDSSDLRERVGTERKALLTGLEMWTLLYFSFFSYFRALLWEPKSIRLAALNTEKQTFLKNRGNFWGQQVKNE